jgi:multidrug efflux pump subunit AcrB
MNLPELCLRRPVFAAVANLVIIAIGLVAATRLPVRELPDIDAAQISIRTDYRGAAPQVMDSQVTEIIEAAVAGVAGVDSIESSSEQGDSVVRVRFVSTRDIDDAANDIRGAVGRVTSRLPEEAGEPRMYKNDADADPIMRIGITSTRWSAAEITDYADRYLVDRSPRSTAWPRSISTVARYAMRIGSTLQAMAARQLAVTDVVDALTREQCRIARRRGRVGDAQLPAPRRHAPRHDRRIRQCRAQGRRRRAGAPRRRRDGGNRRGGRELARAQRRAGGGRAQRGASVASPTPSPSPTRCAPRSRR